MAGISVWQLVIIAAIVILLFGTKKLSRLGSDVGTSIKEFKRAVGDNPNQES
ncbi:twin-arginine translocase TatA/TatE family subunit [Pseudoalteromonas pernae]|uniref:twin-arginine translocase TatA/TatE family subunit n=1 Tax=Pseudoalteromonas pernae TaxID=3118054 RepID=UPI0032420C17